MMVISFITGNAGVGLALVADFRVTSRDARFSVNFNRLGFHPGFGLSVTLPRLMWQGLRDNIDPAIAAISVVLIVIVAAVVVARAVWERARG